MRVVFSHAFFAAQGSRVCVWVFGTPYSYSAFSHNKRARYHSCCHHHPYNTNLLVFLLAILPGILFLPSIGACTLLGGVFAAVATWLRFRPVLLCE
jgi:hypothetical protein